MASNYKPLKGIVNVAHTTIPDSDTIFLPGEEISGEFLREMKAIQTGAEEALKYYQSVTQETGSICHVSPFPMNKGITMLVPPDAVK